MDVEVGEVEATREGPACQRLEVQERAVAVQEDAAVGSRLGEGTQAGGEVTGAQAGGEGEADRGWHAVTAAEGLGGAIGDDTAGGDHRDPVGEVLGLVHVVGGEKDGLAQGPQAGDDLPGGAPGGGVKAGGGLVEEDELRVADQGEGEVQPPPLAAG